MKFKVATLFKVLLANKDFVANFHSQGISADQYIPNSLFCLK